MICAISVGSVLQCRCVAVRASVLQSVVLLIYKGSDMCYFCWQCVAVQGVAATP